jgi:hypothetical protein
VRWPAGEACAQLEVATEWRMRMAMLMYQLSQLHHPPPTQNDSLPFICEMQK